MQTEVASNQAAVKSPRKQRKFEVQKSRGSATIDTRPLARQQVMGFGDGCIGNATTHQELRISWNLELG